MDKEQKTKINIQKPPCGECVERVRFCHMNCRRYIIWKLKRDAIRKRERKKRQSEQGVIELLTKGKIRTMKKKQKY